VQGRPDHSNIDGVQAETRRAIARLSWLGLVVSVLCACVSTKASVDAGVDGGAGVDAGPLPSCQLGQLCILVDASRPDHVISPLLFGDWFEWTDGDPNIGAGDGIWDQVASAPRSAIVSTLQPVGLNLIRYPGGTLSDFFLWNQAIGPDASRVPQVYPFAPDGGTAYLPYFGPDEVAQVTSALGAQLLVTANIVTDTPQDAAEWLRHYQDAGVQAKYWEIGNENYIPSGSWAQDEGYRAPVQYAALFDQFAQALRAVDPTVQVGVLGCPSCSGWDQGVLQAITQRADFMSVHNGYAPFAAYVSDTSSALEAMLADPVAIRGSFDALEGDLTEFGGPNAGIDLAETEWAAEFVPTGATTDVQWAALNRSLASALYSALVFDLFFADPQIAIANHTNAVSPLWQAEVTLSPTDGISNPTVSAFGHAFRLYADAAGGLEVPVQLRGAPTYSTTGLGAVPPLFDVPELDAAAVIAASGDRLWIYVVNRSLTDDLTARVIALGYPAAGVQAVTSEVLNAASATAVDDPSSPDAVTVAQTSLTASDSLEVTFPAHSLTRLTFQ
jgi:alpha-L-arabinofuranosidase